MRGFRHFLGLGALALASSLASSTVPAQDRGDELKPAPNRRSDEGKGPFKTMVIRGGLLIDGTGGPPRGPVDIVIEGNRIASVRPAGTPGLPLAPGRNPKNADLEIDAAGQYVLPGFVDVHVLWEGTDRASGGGNGVFRRKEVGDMDEAWISIVVGKKPG